MGWIPLTYRLQQVLHSVVDSVKHLTEWILFGPWRKLWVANMDGPYTGAHYPVLIKLGKSFWQLFKLLGIFYNMEVQMLK